MSTSTRQGELRPPEEPASSSSDESTDSTSEPSSPSPSGSESEDDITPEYLESLLEKARQNAAAKRAARAAQASSIVEEEMIDLGEDKELPKLPPLQVSKLPPPYFSESEQRMVDPDIEKAKQSASSHSAPAPPIRPPELTKSGRPLTKREKKKLRRQTAGPDWFDLPAPAEADLPRIYREVEALRLRNQLDPKRFYKKVEGEGQGIKGLPKFIAIGTVVPTSTPFGTASTENLRKASRKRTIVEELVEDAEASQYAKKKFKDMQAVRGARGKGTLAKKQALRRRKW